MSNLYHLLEYNPDARKYFNTLPEHIRDSIAKNADYVLSADALYEYANALQNSKNQ